VTWKDCVAAIAHVMKHFSIQELVTPLRYKVRGDAAWFDFRPELLEGLALLREDWGATITINDWSHRGRLVDCGLRDDGDTGAAFSGHKLGACLDLHTADLQGLRNLVMRNYEKYGITEIEDSALTPTWVHVSWRHTGLAGLKVIK